MDDQLENFCNYFINGSNNLGQIPTNFAFQKYYGDVLGIVWYRDENFQIEIFVSPPNWIIPEHIHPNVDSFEVYLGGQVLFSHSGYWVTDQLARGYRIRVKPDDPHGGVFGPHGACFMSVQHWLNGTKPTSVASDYTGVVMSADHLDSVNFGKAYFKEKLTWRDAASKETRIPPFDFCKPDLNFL